ncbi:MAG: hypothetical protein GYA12_08595 [Chloroflexi bacterium]|jgi:hypothetical protein|nr:hypothetical protein [Chloroflexota bacterium]BCY17659.1 hypothetical protein hrd7_15080 [Leptolinea sp. HRD-7]
MISSSSVPILIIAAIMLITGVVPLIFYYLSSTRNAQHWDDIFMPLGFTGERFMINGRHYSRKFGAHAIDAYVFKGPAMDIRIAVPVNAHLRIFQRDFIPPQMIAGLRQTQPVFSYMPGLEDLAFYPAETPWLPTFLDGVRAAKAIRVLMKDGAEQAAYRQVELAPGELNFHLYAAPGDTPGVIDQDTVNRWVSSLEAMADELQEANLPHFDVSLQSGKSSPTLHLDSRLLVFIMAAFFGIPVCMILVFLFLMME